MVRSCRKASLGPSARLSLGVAREMQLVGESDILLYLERREYLDALNRMATGLEAARVALVKAQQRIYGKSR